MTNSKLLLAAARNVAAQAAYILLVVLFFNYAERYFGSKPDPKFLAPLALLLLFCLSALVSGILILGQPIWLYLEGKKKEALKLLGFTVAAMAAAFVIVLMVMALSR